MTLPAIPFLSAAHFTKGPRTQIDLIVIHTAEVAPSPGAATNLMRACAKTPDLKSWHYAVDSSVITQSVLDVDIAWHAPGANANGIGIELATRASSTVLDWANDYHHEMLGLAAQLVAALCTKWNIPVAFVAAVGLQAGQRGITTHAQVTAAFHKSTHTDPGAGFPLVAFLSFVEAEMPPSPAAA